MKEIAIYLEFLAKAVHSMIVGKDNQSTTTLCYNKLNRTLYVASKADPLALKNFAFANKKDKLTDIRTHQKMRDIIETGTYSGYSKSALGGADRRLA